MSAVTKLATHKSKATTSKLHRKTIVSALENLKFLLFGNQDVSIDHYALLSSWKKIDTIVTLVNLLYSIKVGFF
jgi:hypothetical protein